MKTVTVKQCRELGVVFVRGDVCIEYYKTWFDYTKEGNNNFDRNTLKSFAWRTELPECDQWSGFSFPIEWVDFHGETHITHNGLFFSANVAKWRPHLASIVEIINPTPSPFRGFLSRSGITEDGGQLCIDQRQQNGMDLFNVYLSKSKAIAFGNWEDLHQSSKTSWIETAEEIGYSK